MQNEQNLAVNLYEQAMQYNWRQQDSPENAALARALFERAGEMRHPKALRELAEMMFIGSGGQKEPERAIGLKWAAVRLGDFDAFGEISALLESYAEGIMRSGDRDRANTAARKADDANELVTWLDSYISDVSKFGHLSVGQP